MQALADSQLDSLKDVCIMNEENWFYNERDGCLAPLLVLLARQTNLKRLTMCGNNIKPAQKQQLIDAAIAQGCQPGCVTIGM